MTPNVVRGSGFYGCLAYVFSDGKAVGIVATNMVGRTPAELASEFEMVWQLNLRSLNPVWHVSLSLHPREAASHERWKELIEAFIEKVGKLAGLDETAIDTLRNQYVAVLHGDRDHPHIHLILNRVNTNGEVCYCKWDHNRTQQACRELEKEMDLIQVRGQAIETEPNQILTHDAIVALEAQFEQTGVLDPALEQYQAQHNQRLEELLYERQLQDTIESDQAGDAGRATAESSLDRTRESVARFVALFDAIGDVTETDTSNRPTIAETRIANEQREPSLPSGRGDQDALGGALYRSDLGAAAIRKFDFSPRTFASAPQSVRSANPVSESGSTIAQATNSGNECDRRSLAERLSDRVGDLSGAVAASLNQRRALAVERDCSLPNSSLSEAPDYEFSPPSEWLDGANIGKRVARSLEADLAADPGLERSDYGSAGRNSSPQSRESSAEDTTRNAAEDQSNRNWTIAHELARFAEELQQSTRAKQKQNWGARNTADTDAETAQDDQPEDSQRLQSSPQTDSQWRDDHVSGTDYHLSDINDVHSRSSMVRRSDSSRDQQADLRSPQQHRDPPQADRKSPQVTRPDPSDSIEQKQQFYDQLWQHYNQGLPVSLYPFERDVAIAQKAIQERRVDEARCVIIRGPRAQSYIGTGDRNGAFAYVDQIIVAAQENQLSPQQRDLARFVAKTLDQLLDLAGKNEYEGTNYRTRRSFQKQSLELEAKDGRGVLIRRQQGKISHCNLSQKDYEFFEEINLKLQARPLIQSPVKASQIEMGD